MNSIPESICPDHSRVHEDSPSTQSDPERVLRNKRTFSSLSPSDTSTAASRPRLLSPMGDSEASMDRSKTYAVSEQERRDPADPAVHAPYPNSGTENIVPSLKGTSFTPPSMSYFSQPLNSSIRNDRDAAIAHGNLCTPGGVGEATPVPPLSFGMPQLSMPKGKQSLHPKSIQGASTPYSRPNRPIPSPKVPSALASNIPASLADHDGCLVSVDRCVELLMSFPNEAILLDVRPFAHFSQINIEGSLNLCIPTTLLKRRSFDTQKLEGTFTDESQKRKFSKWKHCRFIFVYDASTTNTKDAVPLANVLKKFTDDGWSGEGLIVRGGFKALSEGFPSLVRQPLPQSPRSSSPAQQKPTSGNLPSVAPVVGGCALPESSCVPHPFFGNIRQNVDLVGGVGQMPIKYPKSMSESKRDLLPSWLRTASDPQDKGLKVSEYFLDLELKELQRMRQALSYEASKATPSQSTSTNDFRIAGIEKGTKNRYKDIYPFEHSRVRLQDVPDNGCDYVNASHVKAEYSNKRFIATQAPTPDTFTDFWTMVWEQDVRLIISLSAEVEGGQVKCHRFWDSGCYGPLHLKYVAHRYVYMDFRDHHVVRVSDKPSTDTDDSGETDAEIPYIIIRYFCLSHSAFPFQPLREITQLQYPSWPDFGTTSRPSHLLELIKQSDGIARAYSTVRFNEYEPEPEGQRPVMVHCSAGCGRTGTFCTVDSVLDILKRRRAEGALRSKKSADERSSQKGWTYDDENLDLIAKTVGDLRTQRPSMIQNLSQFVLCYETVLEWITSQMTPEEALT